MKKQVMWAVSFCQTKSRAGGLIPMDILENGAYSLHQYKKDALIERRKVPISKIKKVLVTIEKSKKS